jgi:hypothetical protein
VEPVLVESPVVEVVDEEVLVDDDVVPGAVVDEELESVSESPSPPSSPQPTARAIAKNAACRLGMNRQWTAPLD